MLRTISIASIILFIFSGRLLYASEPIMRSFLDKNKIGVGEKVKLTVEMEWQQQEDFSIIVTQITPPLSKLLKQVDWKQRALSRLEETGVFAKRVLEYFYIGKEKGTGDITPVVIEYVRSGSPENKKIIKTQPVFIEVISKSARFGRIAVKGIIGILSAALFLGVFIMFRKRVVSSRRGRRKSVNTDKGDLEKEFCEKLGSLNKYKVSGNTEIYYAGVEKALFNYVKKKYNSDLSVESMGKFPGELQKICTEYKFISEKVRFSGYKPEESEQDRLIRGITKYMKSSMLGESEEDSIEIIN